MNSFLKRAFQIGIAATLFLGGLAAGRLAPGPAAAQNRFGQPKTVLHVVVYKFKDTASHSDREKSLGGLKELAAKIPGVRNVWLKTERNQIRDFSGVYAIEFANAEAAADYAESPLHEAWAKRWQELRENSFSFQISNP